MTKELDDAKSITSAFPFLQLLFAFFANGFVFLSVNLPFLLEWAKGRQPGPLYNVLLVIPEFWRGNLHKDMGFGVVLLYCLVALVVGFLLHPLALLLATVLGKLVKWVTRVIGHPMDFYAPAVFFGTGYVKTADWFYHNKEAKIHWEWELFNYYLYGGISLNFIVGTIAFWILLDGSWLLRAVLLVICLLLLGYCLARSAALQAVYDYYSGKADEDKRTAQEKPE
jgi:diacylglycerol kinase